MEHLKDNVSEKLKRLLQLSTEKGASNHGTIIRTRVTYKKIPCYMRDSACRWFIVKKANIF